MDDDTAAALAYQAQLEEEQEHEMKELFAAFVKAQASIEKAAKDKNNPHFRSKYADLGSVVDAIKPALEENGLAFIQKFHDDDKAIKVETIILHSSGEQFSCGVLSIPVSKHDAQGFGSACTYARRYSLQAAFGVAPEDDDGNAATKAKPEQRPAFNLDIALSDLEQSTSMGTLRDKFALYWKVAPEDKKATLKQAYDDLKAHFEQEQEAA